VKETVGSAVEPHETPKGVLMPCLARTLSLAGVLAATLSACIVISREHTVEREPPRYVDRYNPPPPSR